MPIYPKEVIINCLVQSPSHYPSQNHSYNPPHQPSYISPYFVPPQQPYNNPYYTQSRSPVPISHSPFNTQIPSLHSNEISTPPPFITNNASTCTNSDLMNILMKVYENQKSL